MPLRKHRTQPCCQRTPAVEIPEERLPFTITFADAVQVSVKGISELARPPTRIDRVGGSVQHRPVLVDEVLPRALVAGRTRTSKRQISQMESTQISAEISRSGSFGAGPQRLRESLQGDRPSVGARLAVKANGKTLRD
jgi:hypothetical protein